MDGTGNSRPGQIWVYKTVTEEVTVKEYRYIRPWNDYP